MLDELVAITDAKGDSPRSVQARIERPEILAQGGWIMASYADWLRTAHDAAPPWGTPITRPAFLEAVWRADSRLSGVMFSMVSRVAALGWSISGPVKQLERQYEIFAGADLDGWTDFIRPGYIDYLSTDEGFIIETAREWQPDGPLQKIWWMQARTCVPGPVRVGTEIFDLLFMDADGRWKGLKRGQFVRICSMPSADQWRRMLGFCFMSRVLREAALAAEELEFKEERLGNLPPSGIASVTGLTKPQLENALLEFDLKRQEAGSLVFPGVLWLVSNTYGQKAEVSWTSFRSVWEGFDDAAFMQRFMKTLALDAGEDVAEFYQIEAHGATKAQASLQHRKALGKGPAEFMVSWERWVNRQLPKGFYWRFDTPDDEQDKLVEEIRALRIRNAKELWAPDAKGERLFEREEIREMLAEQQVIPQRYVTPPERLATDVLRELWGCDVGTMRYPEGVLIRHRRYWDLNSSALPVLKTARERAGIEAMISLMRKDWETLTALFTAILARWKRDVLARLEDDPDSLDEDSYWEDWGDSIREQVLGPYQLTAGQGASSTGLDFSFERINDRIRLLAEQQAFALVKLDGDESIVRVTRSKLGKVRARLADGTLAWSDLEDALIPLFGEARAKRIGVTENTALWAQGQLTAAEDAGMVEKSSVRADYGRPCPSGVCIRAEAAGWVPLSAEVVPGYFGPAYHPGCYCFLRFR